jgi:hypothetical protein
LLPAIPTSLVSRPKSSDLVGEGGTS